MSPEEFYEKISEIAKDYDIEDGHYAMDNLMCDVLKSLGYKKGIEIFESMERWYA